METVSLLKELERYIIKREGLYALVPQSRRTDAFQVPGYMVPLWVCMLAFVAALPVYLVTESQNPVKSAMGAFLANVVIIFTVAFVLAHLMFDQLMENEDDLGELELIIVVISSAGVAAVAGLFSGTVAASALAVVFSITAALLTLVARRQVYRAYTLLGAVRLAVRATKSSTPILAVLMSLSLAVFLFASFTRELWEALAAIEGSDILAVIMLIFLPASVLTGSPLRREAKRIMKPYLDEEKYNVQVLAKSAPEVLRTTLNCNGSAFYAGELEAAREQLSRQNAEVLNRVADVVQRRVKLVLILLLACSAIILMLVLTAYFSMLFAFLFKPHVLREWTRLGENPPDWTLALIPGLKLPAVTVVTMKISLLLGAFVSSITSIQALTAKTVHEYYEEWLGRDVARALVLGTLYRSLVPEHTARPKEEHAEPALA